LGLMLRTARSSSSRRFSNFLSCFFSVTIMPSARAPLAET
jgi:hypothetical protein